MEQGLALLFPVFLGLLQRGQGEQGKGSVRTVRLEERGGLAQKAGSQRSGAEARGRCGGPCGRGSWRRPAGGQWGSSGWGSEAGV